MSVFFGGLVETHQRCEAHFVVSFDEKFGTEMGAQPTLGKAAVMISNVMFSLGRQHHNISDNTLLGGGFKYCVFSPLLGEDELILTNIFQMG